MVFEALIVLFMQLPELFYTPTVTPMILLHRPTGQPGGKWFYISKVPYFLQWVRVLSRLHWFLY